MNNELTKTMNTDEYALDFMMERVELSDVSIKYATGIVYLTPDNWCLDFIWYVDFVNDPEDTEDLMTFEEMVEENFQELDNDWILLDIG